MALGKEGRKPECSKETLSDELYLFQVDQFIKLISRQGLVLPVPYKAGGTNQGQDGGRENGDGDARMNTAYVMTSHLPETHDSLVGID